uniref:B box-type domain-containing protein n=1 Tax=Poecilia mexicana TaxID=48701 RepID=A0A3B3Y1G0_9TELE
MEVVADLSDSQTTKPGQEEEARVMDAASRTPEWDPEGPLEMPEEREPGSSMSSVVSSIGHWPHLVLDMCEEHEEKLKLYCEDDQLPICLVCGMSRDHKTHNVIPITEAFENYRVGLSPFFFFPLSGANRGGHIVPETDQRQDPPH